MSKGYLKPDGPLLSKPVARSTPKSEYLLALEKRQREEALKRHPFTVLQMRKRTS
jgi:hypothetical protein